MPGGGPTREEGRGPQFRGKRGGRARKKEAEEGREEGGRGGGRGKSPRGEGARSLHVHTKQGDKGRNGHYAETAHQLREGFRPRAPRGRTTAPHRSPAIPPTRSGEQHGLRPALPPSTCPGAWATQGHPKAEAHASASGPQQPLQCDNARAAARGLAQSVLACHTGASPPLDRHSPHTHTYAHTPTSQYR